HDDAHAGIAERQRLCATLDAVAEDRDGLSPQGGGIDVFVVEDPRHGSGWGMLLSHNLEFRVQRSWFRVRFDHEPAWSVCWRAHDADAGCSRGSSPRVPL